ncbi:MAG TPA: MMPL family transporter [Polyangia bacterium]|nr:MMPL family transporter [Polyangia bacterium]
MLGALARQSARWRWPILALCLLATALSAIFSRGLFGRLGYSVFYDPNAESTRAAALAAAEFGASDPDVLALYQLPPGAAAAEGVRDPSVRAALGRSLDAVAHDPLVARVVSDVNVPGDRFTSRDGRGTFAVISLRGEPRAKAAALPRLRRLLALELPASSSGAPITIAPTLGGLVPSGRALTRLAGSSLARGERIALPITGVLLLVIFGSLTAALLPLALGALSILLTLGLLDVLSRFAPVDAFAVNVVTILGLGVAIDYALFVISRYREEVARDNPHALTRAVETAGRSVLFSGVTVAASLAGLLVFPQPFLRSVAFGGIVVVLLAAALALVVLPAALAVLGRRLEWGRLRRRASANATARENLGWRRLAMTVIRRPIVVCVAVTAGLLLLAAPFSRLQPSRADVRSLPSDEEARHVGELLARDFPSASLTPLSIVVAMDGDMLDDQRLGELYDYVARLQRVPDVARVESVLSFAGAHDRASAEALVPKLEAAALAPTKSAGGRLGLGAVLRDRYTLVRVVPTVPPDSARGRRQVEALRSLAPPRASRAFVFGQAPALYDFAAGLRARAPWMLAVVGLSMFVVLLLAFRSVVLPIKAMLMTALSLTASFGAIVFIFQDGRLQRLLHYESLGTIDASLPVVMFAVVFGLSMDYEVLILGRMREAWLRGGRNRAAVVEGLAQTGRLVTGAALLMVVVFSAFAAAPLVFVKALGLGMALAVALDATVVRMLLVPATMALLGRLNWWVPRVARVTADE